MSGAKEMIGQLDLVTVVQIALGAVLLAAVAWRMARDRAGFASKSRYIARSVGLAVMMVGGAMGFAYGSHGGHSGYFIAAAAIIAWIGLGLLYWGNKGMVRRQ